MGAICKLRKILKMHGAHIYQVYGVIYILNQVNIYIYIFIFFSYSIQTYCTIYNRGLTGGGRLAMSSIYHLLLRTAAQ